MTRLTDLSRGFRDRFLGYDDLTAQVRAWADAFPEVVRLRSLATTEEGRSVWFLEIGRDPDRARPAAWVDGNVHASELCGSSVALGIAEDAIRLHVEPDAEAHGLPPHVRETLRGILFYVLPRISPDGAEAVLTTGRFVRSVPRDTRPDRNRPRWICQDVDGDGVALLMRRQDPTGEFVEAPGAPGVLVPRTLDDAGPFYKLYPEGVIEGFDGSVVPDPFFLSDNEPDLNRNFPYAWAPEHEQVGAGSFPTSAPEARAVVELVSQRPNIFCWLNLHTFGGVLIRPPRATPDTKMDQEDLALYRQLEAWATAETGYPTVSSFEEFTYEPDKPLHGSVSDFAYHQRGCLAWVCELWDIFEKLGLPRQKRFVDRYVRLAREDIAKLARWDKDENAGRLFRAWRKVRHPQLGDVEVGGLDPRVGLWNPPYEKVGEVCRGQSAVFLRVAAMAPRLVVARADKTALGGGVSRVDVSIENHGYLATTGIPSAKALAWNEPVWAEAIAEGCELVGPDARREVGHLDGWGHGLYDGSAMVHFMRSRGSTGSRMVRFTVRGKGVLRVRAGSCRIGFVERRIEID